VGRGEPVNLVFGKKTVVLRRGKEFTGLNIRSLVRAGMGQRKAVAIGNIIANDGSVKLR
jgi:hypothetical protein